MFASIVIMSLLLWAATSAVTAFTLEVYGMPVVSDYEWEVQDGLRQGYN